jgi:glycerophosphoryl diester phosphodiesterase
LTADDVPILFHDSHVRNRFQGRITSGTLDEILQTQIRAMPLAAIRGFRADLDPELCPVSNQNNHATPLALLFAKDQGIHPFTPPTLAELFAFAGAYAGEMGKESGKSDEQRRHATRIRFDLEHKRVPFRPSVISDGFDGRTSGVLEQRVIQVIREAGMVERTRIRSFDHCCVRAVGDLEPRLERAILISGAAPISPADLVRQAGAQIYCPEFESLDQFQVQQIHDAGYKVLPWTVNDPEDWQELLDWVVDGITTDFPDRLASFLISRGIDF